VHDVGGDGVPPAVWAALDGAAVVATELGDLEPDPDALREVIRLPRGKGLDQQLPAEKWWDLRDALRGTIQEAELARVRPWYAMSLLTRTLSPPPDPQLDVAVVRRAKARGIPVDHLETWEEQLPQVAGAVGIPDLVEAIDARKTIRCDLARNRAAYAAGDEAWMLRTFQTERTKPLLGPRNAKWLPRLEGYLRGDGAFVAVGIGHLLGDAGLPAMLARAGYRVEPPTPRSPRASAPPRPR
ncbi:MAG: TraB/GumN family protein, partial [Deltaproteobacteria bacterium]|nr:TraB/GumN family protein [Kofleriaceae bacterium]